MTFSSFQRINLARAFYRDAPLYVLDEPSSYLDADATVHLMEVLGTKEMSPSAMRPISPPSARIWPSSGA